jgi:GntR family transcriptional regulator
MSSPLLAASLVEPLYVRLKMALRDLIGDNLRPGDRLPSEPELCRQYGLSRITVRQALSALESEGVIERYQGRGTFVAAPKRDEPAAYFGSFTEEVAAQGRRGSTRLVSSQLVNADTRVADRLRIPAGDRVFKIRRVRMADRQPICYQVSYVPHGLLSNVAPDEFRRGSLYQRLEAALGEPLYEAEECIEVMRADPYRAGLLQIKTGAPLLVLERLTLTRSGKAVEYNRSFYNGQLVRLSLRSRRAPIPMAVNRLTFRDNEEVVAVND